MFPRRARLNTEGFAAPGKRFSSAHFSVVAPHGGVRGYAVVVSKKTARQAVARHRLKRRVSAALHTLDLPPALIVYPRASVLELPAREIRAELASLVSKIKF